MNKILMIFLALILFLKSNAQYKIHFILKERTAIHHDSIYITGTFSNWDSTTNKNYLMQPAGENKKSIVLNLPEGTIRYKYHRGSWLSVEKQDNGQEVPDRVINIHRDTTLTDSVMRWRDQMFVDKWYALSKETNDTDRVKTLSSIATAYAFSLEDFNLDSALFYAQATLQLQQKISTSGDKNRETQTEYVIQLLSMQEIVAILMHSLGNYPKSLELRLENLKLAERQPDKILMLQAINNITSDYLSMKDYQHALSYTRIADSILAGIDTSDTRYPIAKYNIKSNLATDYYNLKMSDSALYHAQQMISITGLPFQQAYLAGGYKLLADIYVAKGEYKKAMPYYRFGIAILPDFLIAGTFEGMAKIFQHENLLDSALFYAKASLAIYKTQKTVQSWGENSNYYVAEVSPLIAEIYKARGQPDSAYKYLQLSISLKDSLYNNDKIRQFQTLTFNEVARRQQLEQQSREAKQQYETKLKIYGLISIITGFVVLAFVLYRNNRQKQKANNLLQSQKHEIETTLGELKNTQKQLIHAEKMASLGELTAGIAHEIQNPLNFVNNFSDVNAELVDELKSELGSGNMQSAMEIADSIKDNEQKINHHGKRADAIVKGMLQHSRTSSGQKEMTDINALCDEYLRLAYHGLRAKDKTFNAKFETSFDNSIGKINIVPQEIGRVILNLINNAFYAAPLPPEGGFRDPNSRDEPTVWVSTRNLGDRVQISVRDNGPGISKKILDKIFQPFFTTKPTGQGTGLGLSLAYDIITKGHAGDLQVETKEGEGATFIIILPAN